MSGDKWNRVAINLDEVDFDKLQRVGKKVQELLHRKLNNPIDHYLLLKLLCLGFEKNMGFHFEPEDEDKLRDMLAEV